MAVVAGAGAAVVVVLVVVVEVVVVVIVYRRLPANPKAGVEEQLATIVASEPGVGWGTVLGGCDAWAGV